MTLPLALSLIGQGFAPKEAIVITNLNGSGVGTNQFRNDYAGIVMIVATIGVISNPTSASAQCAVSGVIAPIDTSYTAGTGDTAGSDPEYLFPSQQITFAWTGGPANGQGIARLVYFEVPSG